MAIENPNVIDAVIYDSEKDCVSLVLIHSGIWNENPSCLNLLKDKLGRYLQFLLDGQFNENYPQYLNKNVVFQLECTTAPSPEISIFLDEFRSALEKEYKLQLLINIHDDIF